MSLFHYFCTLLLLLFTLNSSAEPTIYTIEGKFEAVFPGQPEFSGEMGEGKLRQKQYSYLDQTNTIMYTAYYQVDNSTVSMDVIGSYIKGVIKGKALAMNGTVLHQDIGKLGSDYGGYFTINYKYKGATARNNGAVIYHDGHVYQWSVTDFPSISTIDGQNIFNNYVKYFRVK